MREFHCRACGQLLFRTDADANVAGRVQRVCPDRRCQRMNTYRMTDDDRPGNRRLFLERWRDERGARAPTGQGAAVGPA